MSICLQSIGKVKVFSVKMLLFLLLLTVGNALGPSHFAPSYNVSDFVRVVDEFQFDFDKFDFADALANFAENCSYYSPDYGLVVGKQNLLNLLETIPSFGIVAIKHEDQGTYVGGIDGNTLIRIWRDAIIVRLPNATTSNLLFNNVVTFTFQNDGLISLWTEYAAEAPQSNATMMMSVVKKLYAFEEQKNVDGILQLLTPDFHFDAVNVPCNIACFEGVLKSFFSSADSIDIIASEYTVSANHVNVEGTLFTSGPISISPGCDVFELVTDSSGHMKIQSWLSGARI